jgi:hypothetical protein
VSAESNPEQREESIISPSKLADAHRFGAHQNQFPAMMGAAAGLTVVGLRLTDSLAESNRWNESSFLSLVYKSQIGDSRWQNRLGTTDFSYVA